MYQCLETLKPSERLWWNVYRCVNKTWSSNFWLPDLHVKVSNQKCHWYLQAFHALYSWTAAKYGINFFLLISILIWYMYFLVSRKENQVFSLDKEFVSQTFRKKASLEITTILFSQRLLENNCSVNLSLHFHFSGDQQGKYSHPSTFCELLRFYFCLSSFLVCVCSGRRREMIILDFISMTIPTALRSVCYTSVVSM